MSNSSKVLIYLSFFIVPQRLTLRNCRNNLTSSAVRSGVQKMMHCQLKRKIDFAFQRNQQTIYNFGYRQLSSQKLEGAIKEFLDLEATLGTSINDV